MISIRDSQVRTTYSSLTKARETDPTVNVYGKSLLKLLAGVGDTWLRGEAKLLADLSRPGITRAEQLAVVQKGMDAKEKADLVEILDKGTVPMTDDVRAFLTQLVGPPVGAVAAGDGFVRGATATPPVSVTEGDMNRLRNAGTPGNMLSVRTQALANSATLDAASARLTAQSGKGAKAVAVELLKLEDDPTVLKLRGMLAKCEGHIILGAMGEAHEELLVLRPWGLQAVHPSEWMNTGLLGGPAPEQTVYTDSDLLGFFDTPRDAIRWVDLDAVKTRISAAISQAEAIATTGVEPAAWHGSPAEWVTAHKKDYARPDRSANADNCASSLNVRS